MQNFAIILARGGSKGIENKNLMDFCGKPLIEWTIDHCKNCKYIKEIFVSSDSNDILNFSNSKNIRTIVRPSNISEDDSSSEDAWSHALDYVSNEKGYEVDYIIAPQVTSPIREVKDLNNAIEKFIYEKLDSLLSVNELKDFFIWKQKGSKFVSDNYDYQKRSRRQLINTKYHENGSFYIFKASEFLVKKNRLFKKIGMFKMNKKYGFEVDDIEDLLILKKIFKI